MRGRYCQIALIAFPLLSTPATAQQSACSNGLDCYTKALEKLQAAEDALGKAVNQITSLQEQINSIKGSQVAIPVGTVLPYSGNIQDAAGLQPLGWWICDGRTVTDASATAWINKQTPDLRGLMLVGSTHAGDKSGDNHVPIPDLNVDVRTTPNWGNQPSMSNVPHELVIQPGGWTGGMRIRSEGVAHGTTIPIQGPPSESVIYLLKVR